LFCDEGIPQFARSGTNRWQGCVEGRKLAAMSGSTPNGGTGEKNGWMRVLGVDPAAAGPTGYGIIESDGRRCRMLHYGALKVAAGRQREGVGAALQDVHALLCQLIEEFAPNAMAVESVFTALNMRTALRLAEVRGVVLLAAAQHGLEVHSYAPREVKASIAGHGHADKRQMQIMVRALLSMTVTPEPADAADALAVALCHLQAEQARRRFGLPAKTDSVKKRSLATAVSASNGITGGLTGLQTGSTTRSGLPRIVSTR
jgi:crossover junction endodeoxyribonuclease RuvC